MVRVRAQGHTRVPFSHRLLLTFSFLLEESLSGARGKRWSECGTRRQSSFACFCRRKRNISWSPNLVASCNGVSSAYLKGGEAGRVSVK